jgi:hypothetical protein
VVWDEGFASSLSLRHLTLCKVAARGMVETQQTTRRFQYPGCNQLLHTSPEYQRMYYKQASQAPRHLRFHDHPKRDDRFNTSSAAVQSTPTGSRRSASTACGLSMSCMCTLFEDEASVTHRQMTCCAVAVLGETQARRQEEVCNSSVNHLLSLQWIIHTHRYCRRVLLFVSGEVVNTERRSSALRQDAMLGRQLSGPHVSRCASSRYLPSTSYPVTLKVWQSEIAVVLGAARACRNTIYDLLCFTVDARRYRSAQTASGRPSPGTRILEIVICVNRSC